MSPWNGSGKVSAELSEKWVGEWKGGVRWEEEREVRRSGGSECACVFGGGKRMMREKKMSM